MKILITNDDGYISPGIISMARCLLASGHNVTLVAPDRERSGCGHAMTMGEPVELWKVDVGIDSENFAAYACSGTPTDCVILGFDALDGGTEMVISGINQGPNLADDITYSGTACAAMEGVISGVPAIAVSLDLKSYDDIRHNETAAEIVMSVLRWTKSNPMPKGIFYNINVPNVHISELRGITVTKKGVRRYVDKISSSAYRNEVRAFMIGGRIEDVLTEGTDVWAVSHGFASVTPVHLEMTSFKDYEDAKRKGMEEQLASDLFYHNNYRKEK